MISRYSSNVIFLSNPKVLFSPTVRRYEAHANSINIIFNQ